MERATMWTRPANVGSRQTALAISAMLVAIVVAGGLVAAGGLERSDFAVKATLLLTVAIVAVTIVVYRPVLFPLSAYIVAVPFDAIMQTGAGTATKFLALVSIAVLLVVMINRRRTVGPPLALVTWAALLVWEIATLMWSPAPETAVALWSTISLFLFFTVLAMLQVRPQEAYFLAAAAIVGGVALAVYGIALHLQGSDQFLTGADETRLVLRTSSGTMDPNHFAGSLIVPITFAMVLALRSNSWTKWLAASALFVLLGGVYVTAARGTMIAVGVIVLYLLIFYRQRLQLGALALVGLLLSAGMPSVWMRFLDPNQGEASGRFGIWSLAWIAYKAHWLFGIGAAQFRIAYEEAYLKAPAAFSIQHRWIEDSHNLIVSSSVELGIIGLALMLAAWFFQFRVVHVIPRSSRLFELRVAVEASTIGLFILAMSLDLMSFKYLWLGFMMALLVRNAYVAETKTVAAQETTIARFGNSNDRKIASVARTSTR
jgi:O-antigen ligase